MAKAQSYIAIGLMSGTSLDGLDMACGAFSQDNGQWNFRILQAETLDYSTELRERLRTAPELPKDELAALDTDYGHFLGKSVSEFIRRHKLAPDLVASHGHTVFHRPDLGYTLQIGAGKALKSYIDCPLVYDFRSQDVALGGQGAPLVPIGDQLLFDSYAACVNIGGFANISLRRDAKRMAWDIGPANIVLNVLARRLKQEFDAGGNLARKGKLLPDLSAQLNVLEFYGQKPPKSLGKEWVDRHISPLLEKSGAEVHDLLRTFTEHIAEQISRAIAEASGKVLFTGGGVYNDFLMELIRAKADVPVEIPEPQIVEYKEALIFAFMGVLRMRGEVNVLASVTGARQNHSSGFIIRD
jgi:anhydro-N-acetylmuramic acid kinase